MNKEYMILSDGSLAVTNEKGQIIKRNFNDLYNFNEILECENKLEIVNDDIKKLNENLIDCKEKFSSCKKEIIATSSIIPLSTIGSFAIGVILTGVYTPYGIYTALFGLALSSVLAGSYIVLKKIERSQAKKQITALTSTIEKAEELKKQYEKELKEINQRSVTEAKTNYVVNTPTSLNNQNDLINEYIESVLDEAYNEATNNKTKRLLLHK